MKKHYADKPGVLKIKLTQINNADVNIVPVRQFNIKTNNKFIRVKFEEETGKHTVSLVNKTG